ncbi:MAG: VOC family protein [Gammaproteobacteria bacterium]|nr:VOC family protein [Gammaproteobacteria bacterium]
MSRQIYVNVPVKDLARSKAFFSNLGFSFKSQFTNDVAACLVVSDNSFVMLLTEQFFQTFTSKAISNAKDSTEVLICLSCESRAEIDDLVRKAVNAGGSAPRSPQDHGFMYSHGFEDVDGHIWELIYIEPVKN